MVTRLGKYLSMMFKRAKWFKRANLAMNDNWKYDLHMVSNGDLINIKAGHTVL
jgi:hypothetical protein